MLCCSAGDCVLVYCSVLYCTVLYCIVLYCTVEYLPALWCFSESQTVIRTVLPTATPLIVITEMYTDTYTKYVHRHVQSPSYFPSCYSLPTPDIFSLPIKSDPYRSPSVFYSPTVWTSRALGSSLWVGRGTKPLGSGAMMKVSADGQIVVYFIL